MDVRARSQVVKASAFEADTLRSNRSAPTTASFFDAVVIGAGIFGSIITRALRSAGIPTLTVDARRANSGSAPAACLMRPSWYSALGKHIYAPALNKLLDLVGVQELTFRVVMTSTKVLWCNPAKVFWRDTLFNEVTRLIPVVGGWEVHFKTGAPVKV